MCNYDESKSLLDFRGETPLGPRFLQEAAGADPQSRGRETQAKETSLPDGQDSSSEARRRVGCFSTVLLALYTVSRVCSESLFLSLQRGRGRSVLQTPRRTRTRAPTPWRERRRRRTWVMMEGAALLRRGREQKHHRREVNTQTNQVREFIVISSLFIRSL